MKQYTIVLKKKAIEAAITIKSIPLRIFGIIKNSLVLKQFSQETSIIKYANFKHVIEQNTLCGNFFKTVYERFRHTIELQESQCDSTLSKYASSPVHMSYLGSEVKKSQLSMYTKLVEIDLAGGIETLVSDHDNTLLDDLDYVVVE